MANILQNTQHTPTKWGANTPSGVGADSSCPYPCIIKYAYPHYQTRAFTLLHAHFRLSFRGCFRICGRDKSDPYGCEQPANYIANIPQNANKQSVKYPHTPTKCVANNPPGVGADSSCPYPDINKNVYFHNQICVFKSPNMYFYIIKYVYSFHRTRISTLLNTHFHITTRTFPFVISWVFSYMRAR